MARSLGLTAYRAMARRAEANFSPPSVPRPSGELVWIHAGEPENLLGVRDLSLRMMNFRSEANTLITYVDSKDTPAETGRPIEAQLPSEHPAAISSFLDHWAPDLCIWTWGKLRPNLIMSTADRSCRLMLIDAETTGFDLQRDRWLPDVTRQVLSLFGTICCRSPQSYRRLRNLGVPAGRLEQTSPLLSGGEALTCSDSDLEELSTTMTGRPAWFADGVATSEIPVIIVAHRLALRVSHRLLLFIRPGSASDAQAAREEASGNDLVVAEWDEGEVPDESTQVVIANQEDDRGLFFRVAPVSFMGGTLVPEAEGWDPLDAAALGSAVLYGPRVRQFLPSYTRLAAAGAARIINDEESLGNAISRLIQPDQAATMAHAGWDVISQGAALTDRVIELAQDALDGKLDT